MIFTSDSLSTSNYSSQRNVFDSEPDKSFGGRNDRDSTFSVALSWNADRHDLRDQKLAIYRPHQICRPVALSWNADRSDLRDQKLAIYRPHQMLATCRRQIQKRLFVFAVDLLVLKHHPESTLHLLASSDLMNSISFSSSVSSSLFFLSSLSSLSSLSFSYGSASCQQRTQSLKH
jgi:hypothetical protein